ICLNNGKPHSVPQQSQQAPAPSDRLNFVRSQNRANVSNNGNRSGNQSQSNHATRNQPLQSASQNSCPQQTQAKQLATNVPRVNMAVTCPENNQANMCSFATNQNNDSSEDCRVLANDINREIVNLKTYYQTCLVEIGDKIVRIVLDSAGGRSVITEDLCEELDLEVFASQNINI